MIFSAPVFIFAFLPLVLLGFFALASTFGRKPAVVFLVFASLFFYGWWKLAYLPILLGSIFFNYAIGSGMCRAATDKGKRAILTGGVIANLALLGYFKYCNFFVGMLNDTGAHLGHFSILLPLGISFFTFTQIAYLVDTYREGGKSYSLADYFLFVTYFPHLIAGPIIHHRNMIPQFSSFETKLSAENFAIGLTTFLCGLFKKVLIADSIAQYAEMLFGGAARGVHIGFVEAWLGVLAYTLQLYFDFSGYSDMAIGLGRMFNIKLPINFDSPYKAISIVDFWRRWHMTLSAFLRDYLYIPLGGNRKGDIRRHVNLMATMLLGGLWHGAGWTFVFWGGLHGAYLIVNHLWRTWARKTGVAARFDNRGGRVLGGALTFLAVVFAWVFFRADNWSSAVAILHGMSGLNGVSLPANIGGHLGPFGAMLRAHGVTFDGLGILTGNSTALFTWIPALLIAVWLLPDTQQWMARWEPGLGKVDTPSRWQWRPAPVLGFILGVCFFLVVKSYFTAAPTKFLYFNF
jgi:alginate O-acetyltransferase complex protein AlgI